MKKGFTFIEIIVVVGVIGIVLPAVFSIIFLILKEQVKILSLTEIKRQGDYSLNIMRNVIRNDGAHVYDADDNEICTGITSELQDVVYFKDKDGNNFRFYSDPVNAGSYYRIVSELPSSAKQSLFTPKVRLSNSNPTLTIKCSRSSAFSTPIVYIKFIIEYNTSASNPDEQISMTFQTSVKMKNY